MLSSSSNRRANASHSDSAYEDSQAFSMSSITNSSYESTYNSKNSNGASSSSASISGNDKKNAFSLATIKNWFGSYSSASSPAASSSELKGADSRLPLLSDAVSVRCAATGASKCCCSTPNRDCVANENIHTSNTSFSSATNSTKNNGSYALTAQAREGLAKLGGRISSLWEHPKRD